MGDTKNPSLDLSFIIRDVRNQLAHSKGIVEQAKELGLLADKIGDENLKLEIKNKALEFLKIAEELANNANQTSSVTVSTTAASSQFFTPGHLEK